MSHNGGSPSDFKQIGLVHKYDVKRAVDPDGKHDECRYFVLDPQHDLHARAALTKYAEEVRLDGYEALADDLDAWVDRLDRACAKCIEEFGQMPSAWGESVDELDAYAKHQREHGEG